MRRVADEYATLCDKRPLIVKVNEHGGWSLSYLYGAPGIDDGTICGTANDAACLPQAVIEFVKSVNAVATIEDISR